MEIFAVTPENLGLDGIGALAKRVESMGYDGLFVADAIHDGLLLACQALAATQRIRVATSVLIVFPRSPMNVALAAWDLQRISGGRFELGLGTQIKQNIEDRYSARWLPPAAGMKEYVGALRAIFHSFRTREPLNGNVSAACWPFSSLPRLTGPAWNYSAGRISASNCSK